MAVTLQFIRNCLSFCDCTSVMDCHFPALKQNYEMLLHVPREITFTNLYFSLSLDVKLSKMPY